MIFFLLRSGFFGIIFSINQAGKLQPVAEGKRRDSIMLSIPPLHYARTGYEPRAAQLRTAGSKSSLWDKLRGIENLMKQLTKQQAKVFLNKWRAVENFEKAQLRTVSFLQKYRQLMVLFSARDLFFLSKREKEAQRTKAQQNWKRLRARLVT